MHLVQMLAWVRITEVLYSTDQLRTWLIIFLRYFYSPVLLQEPCFIHLNRIQHEMRQMCDSKPCLAP